MRLKGAASVPRILFVKPAVTGLATRRTWREHHPDLAALDPGQCGAMQLHRTLAVADLEGQSGGVVESDMLNHLADDLHELARRHVAAVLVHVPKLDEDFRPVFRVRPAIQRLEMPCLDFSDMIAGLHVPAVIAEHQWQAGDAIKRRQKLANGNILRVGRAGERAEVALNRHLRYLLIRYF